MSLNLQDWVKSLEIQVRDIGILEKYNEPTDEAYVKLVKTSQEIHNIIANHVKQRKPSSYKITRLRKNGDIRSIHVDKIRDVIVSKPNGIFYSVNRGFCETEEEAFCVAEKEITKLKECGFVEF